MTAARWHQFMETVQPHEVQVFSMKEVDIGYCCEDVFDFIVQCNTLEGLLISYIQNSNSDRDIATGLIRVLPRLDKLKWLDIWDVYIVSEVFEVINSVNSQYLRILSLSFTDLSWTKSPVTLALHRFPHLMCLDLCNSLLKKDKLLSVLDELPSSCPDIVYLSIYPEKFTSKETKPLCKLKKLICLQLNFRYCLRALGHFPQPLEMINMYDNPSIENDFDMFISIISSYTKLRYLAVNEGELNFKGGDKVSKLMVRKGGRLVVRHEDSQGWKEYQDRITELKEDCMSS